MSFLDNLESNLKSLESRDEAEESGRRTGQERASSRAEALAIGPWADQLKKSPYTAELLRQATRHGFASRTKVHIAWLGNTLRLEARDRKLELRPTAQGIVAAWIENGSEPRTEPIDLNGSAEELVRRWVSYWAR